MRLLALPRISLTRLLMCHERGTRSERELALEESQEGRERMQRGFAVGVLGVRVVRRRSEWARTRSGRVIGRARTNAANLL